MSVKIVPGVYRHEQLVEFGLSAEQIEKLSRGGGLERLRRGWFATGGHDPAVAAAVKSGGALSCVSALDSHGLWVAPGYAGTTHVRRSRKLARKHGGGCHPYGCMPSVEGPVDPVALALECALHCMSEEDWIAVCDSACNTLGLAAEAMRAEMGALPEWAMRWFGKVEPAAQSGTESITRVRLRAAHYTVVVQPKIKDVGRSDLRIGRLVIECDSETYHCDPESYRYDRQRDRKATAAGWIPFRLTYEDILYGWEEVLADIRAITQADRHRIRGHAAMALKESRRTGFESLKVAGSDEIAAESVGDEFGSAEEFP
ncbi:MAG: hypothetical protein QM658_06420 [Gordonia sp. (in: high G+C Gram-positive bacteria)]